MRSEEASAFDRGLEAEKVLGATDATVRFHSLVFALAVACSRLPGRIDAAGAMERHGRS